MLLFWYRLTVLSSISAKDLACTMFLFCIVLISSLSSFFNVSNAKFLCSIPLISARNVSDNIDTSGFFNPAALKISTTSSVAIALDTICLIAESNCSSLFPVVIVVLAKDALTAWKKPTSSRIFSAASFGTANANACESPVTYFSNLSLPSSCFRTWSIAAGINAIFSFGVPVKNFL
ncbi:MAG: hypothetical protein DDT31_01478 [Syntrophomonadaceae bacterium]|nr:hypothetical protein [Bacillota bacterium]